MLTLERALSSKSLVYFDYGSAIEVTPTGRFIDAKMDSLILVEVKRGIFGFDKKWHYLNQLSEIQNKNA